MGFLFFPLALASAEESLLLLLSAEDELFLQAEEKAKPNTATIIIVTDFIKTPWTEYF
jgi:hypothetical protein